MTVAAIAPSILEALQHFCGGHVTFTSAGVASVEKTLAGPVLGNALVASVAGIATVACFIVAGWMLLKPGERNPNHPKYSVLSDNR